MEKIEIINNSFSKIYKSLSYADNADIHNTSLMLMNWFFENNPNAVDVVFNASRVDRLDFVSSLTFAFVKINNGWNGEAIRIPIGNKYVKYGPVIISENNIKLSSVVMDLIKYMVLCRNILSVGVTA